LCPQPVSGESRQALTDLRVLRGEFGPLILEGLQMVPGRLGVHCRSGGVSETLRTLGERGRFLLRIPGRANQRSRLRLRRGDDPGRFGACVLEQLLRLSAVTLGAPGREGSRTAVAPG